MLDRRPVEPGQPASESGDEAISSGHLDNPIEEVAVDHAVEACRDELVTAEQRCRGEFRSVEAEN